MDVGIHLVIEKFGGHQAILSLTLESIKETTDEIGDGICCFDSKILIDSIQRKFLSKCGYILGSIINGLLISFSSLIDLGKDELTAEIEQLKDDPNFISLCKDDLPSKRLEIANCIMDSIVNSTVFTRGPIGRSFHYEWNYGPLRVEAIRDLVD
jgi:hypothetical protein